MSIEIMSTPVTECLYWIKSCISDPIVKCSHLLPHVVSTVARAGLPQHHRNPEGSYTADSQKTCFPAVKIFNIPVF